MQWSKFSDMTLQSYPIITYLWDIACHFCWSTCHECKFLCLQKHKNKCSSYLEAIRADAIGTDTASAASSWEVLSPAVCFAIKISNVPWACGTKCDRMWWAANAAHNRLKNDWNYLLELLQLHCNFSDQSIDCCNSAKKMWQAINTSRYLMPALKEALTARNFNLIDLLAAIIIERHNFGPSQRQARIFYLLQPSH